MVTAFNVRTDRRQLRNLIRKHRMNLKEFKSTIEK